MKSKFILMSLLLLTSCSGIMPITLSVDDSKPVYFGNYALFSDQFKLGKTLTATDLSALNMSSSSSQISGTSTTRTETIQLANISKVIRDVPSSAFINNLNIEFSTSVTNYISTIKTKNIVSMHANEMGGE